MLPSEPPPLTLPAFANMRLIVGGSRSDHPRRTSEDSPEISMRSGGAAVV
jgi:hypothetical protein